jgi:hypothetical protein
MIDRDSEVGFGLVAHISYLLFDNQIWFYVICLWWRCYPLRRHSPLLIYAALLECGHEMTPLLRLQS